MIRFTRLALLIVPLALGAALPVRHGRAQTPDAPRFVFADTTLLRDTLDLKFDRLFELADSLAMGPDSLRAHSVRYRMSLARLVEVADSLRIPVDSVGVVLARERLNPLAVREQRVTRFQYTSSYYLTRNNSSWGNFGDLGLVRGPVYLNSRTDIRFDRQQAGGLVLRQSRLSDTEAGWKFSPNFSVGGRVLLERFDGVNPGGIGDDAETKNEFQFSSRTKQRPSRNLSSEINVLSGALSLHNNTQVKNGISGDLNGKLRVQRGRWLTHDLAGRISGNFARARAPNAVQQLDSRDAANNINGTLALLSDTPAGLNVNYGLKRTRVETPADSNRIQQIRTDDDRLDVTLRFRRDNDRYLNVSERLARRSQVSAATVSSQNETSTQGFNVQGRYRAGGWFIDGSFDNTFSDSRFPRRSTTGGYGDRTSARSIQATATRTFHGRFTVKGDGRVSLSQSRYYIIGEYPTPPVDRDQYRQLYRLDGQYNRSARFSTGLALEVIRSRYINLPSASTGANNETRTYRAEWRWTFRLLPGLTATQRDRLSADYVYYDFLPTNNRLSLNYAFLTTLNALITPRTTLEITHDAQTQPSGNYLRFEDGIEYFTKADESNTYTLRARVAYAPSSVLSINLQTEYLANERVTITNEALVPQRDNATLNFSGGGTLNLPLGRKGTLSGDLSRSYRADRSILFQAGVPQLPARSEFDYWNGRLELTWQL